MSSNGVVFKKPNIPYFKMHKSVDFAFACFQDTWYRMEGKLGSGGFGVVSRAINPELGKILAVKKICFQQEKENRNPNPRQRSEFVEMVYNELTIQKYLSDKDKDNEFVVKVFGMNECYRNVHILMECAENGSVFDSLEKLSKDPQLLKNMFRQFVFGVEFLHNSHIVHMDLKPGNLLLTSADQLKICDFGLSCPIPNGDEEQRKFYGTRMYGAPETHLNEKVVLLPLDMWAVGVTLMTFVIGNEDCWDIAKVSDHRYQDWQLKGHEYMNVKHKVDRNCFDLLCKLLEEDGNKRPTIKEVTRHPFMKIHNLRKRRAILVIEDGCKRIKH